MIYNTLVKKDAGIKLSYIEVPFEIKSIHDDDEEFFIFEGLASTFNEIDLVDDVIRPGAFQKSLQARTPIILWQHKTNEPIGMPLEIKETPEGLFVKVRLPKEDTLVSGRVIPQMKVGSIKKMSIGFNVADKEIDGRLRILKEIELFEISLVTFPANPNASVTGFKSIEELLSKTDISEDDLKLVLADIKKEQDSKADKKFTLEDVNNIKDKKALREFFKSTELFTKQAREHLVENVFKSVQGELEEDDKGQGDLDQKAMAATLAAYKKLGETLNKT